VLIRSCNYSYDIAELTKLIFQHVVHTIITLTLLNYMGVSFPLVLQTIMLPLNLKSGALVQIHMYEQPAKGKLVSNI
jgi:hypothetical protein